MQYVRIILYFTVAFDFNIAGVAAEIISGQVNQHNMLGIFFQVSRQLLGKQLVFFVIAGAPESPGNGIDNGPALLYLKLCLRRRAKYLIIAIIKEKKIR